LPVLFLSIYFVVIAVCLSACRRFPLSTVWVKVKKHEK